MFICTVLCTTHEHVVNNYPHVLGAAQVINTQSHTPPPTTTPHTVVNIPTSHEEDEYIYIYNSLLRAVWICIRRDFMTAHQS